MRKQIGNIFFLIHFIRYAQDPSAKGVERFMHFMRHLRKTKRFEAQNEEILDHIKKDKYAAKIIEERYLPEKITVEELAIYPKDSLGHEFYKFLKLNSLELNIYANFQVNSPIEYISYRGGQLHDLLHVLTGFGVDHFGEFSVQAFTFAQTKSPMVGLFLAGDLLYASRKGPNWAFDAFNAMVQGFQLGLKSKNFYSIKWENRFSHNLNQLRFEMGLQQEHYFSSKQ